MIRVLRAALFLLATVSPALALDCPLDRATYTPVDADDDWSAPETGSNVWEITHVRQDGTSSDRPWILRLTEKRQNLSADFTIADPPGLSAVHVVMLSPPGGRKKGFDAAKAPSSLLYYFGEDMKRVDPTGGDMPKAPPLMQLPGLSQAFWAWKRDGRRFIPPDGVWKLTACRA